MAYVARQGLLWRGVWYFMVNIMHVLSTTIVVLWLCRGRPESEMWCVCGALHCSAGAPTPAAPLSRFLPPNGIHGLWSASCPVHCTRFRIFGILLNFVLQAGCIPMTAACAMTFCLYIRKGRFLALSAMYTAAKHLGCVLDHVQWAQALPEPQPLTSGRSQSQTVVAATRANTEGAAGCHICGVCTIGGWEGGLALLSKLERSPLTKIMLRGLPAQGGFEAAYYGRNLLAARVSIVPWANVWHRHALVTHG